MYGVICKNKNSCFLSYLLTISEINGQITQKKLIEHVFILVHDTHFDRDVEID